MNCRVLGNALGFQLCWFAWVAAAAHGALWLGALATVLFAVWQLAISPYRIADMTLILICLAAGMVIDGTFAATGLIVYALPGPLPAPLWILGLWAVFALTLNHSLRFLGGRPLLAAVLGSLGAPLAYFAAAEGWHAARFGGQPLLTLALLGLCWAALVPLLVELSARLRRASRSSTLSAVP